MKKQALHLLVLLLTVAVILGGILTVATAEETPAVSISYFTLSHENAVYIQYAVDCTGFAPDTENIGMLFWTSEPKDPVLGTENSRGQVLGWQDIENKTHYIFKYTDLSAKQMCDVIWARAYAFVDDTYYYSDVESYSIVTYAARMLGLVDGIEGTSDETLKTLLREMLEYGEAAQKHFKYNTEVLPTDILPENRFTVTFDTVGGSEIPAQTVCRDRRVIEPKAPTKDGYTFTGWFDSRNREKWNFETDTVTENITLTAGWEESIRYSEGLVFTSNGDGTCSFSGIGSCTDTEIYIPPVSPDGDTVTRIDDYAFSWYENLTSIIIPNSVTSISDYAFECCSGLMNITVDENNKRYHSAGNCLIETEPKILIAGCHTSVIPTDGSVTSIGDRAFYYCSGLTSITIPNSVTSIGDRAFYYCSGLTSITIPDSVTSIGNYAFQNCSNLTSITIPEGVTSIGHAAFYGCSSMTSINIPDSVTSIGNYAFYNCSRLTSITIPDGVTSIDENAFSACSSLTSITIPDSVTRIGYYAFSDCSSLTSITIPEGVTSIGSQAFYSCKQLTDIYYSGTMVEWNAITKGSDWNTGTGAYTVHCMDGDIAKS